MLYPLHTLFMSVIYYKKISIFSIETIINGSKKYIPENSILIAHNKTIYIGNKVYKCNRTTIEALKYLFIRLGYKYQVYHENITDLNPIITIVPTFIQGKEQRKFNVVRDDLLLGGTKQRALVKILQSNPATEFVYAGPTNGYAQVALAYVAQKVGKKATIFLATERPRNILTKLAEKYGAKIIEVGFRSKLEYVQEKASQYVKSISTKRGREYIYLLPFGLYTKDYINTLAEQIKKACPTQLLVNNPKRMWLVAGSSALLNALYIVFPKTFFNVVQVGKKIWPDQIDGKKTKIYISDEKFWEDANEQPPYNTVPSYDAKLWKYVVKYGRNGDYIWNVGGVPD